MNVRQVRKRDGRLEEFSLQKITGAIHKALEATGEGDGETAKSLSAEVLKRLDEKFGRKPPEVEEIQDVVEQVLIQARLYQTAKAYILYRAKRAELREAKKFLGVADELKLSINAIAVLERRYLLKDDQGRIVETPTQLFRRVAKAIAQIDRMYGSDPKKSEEEFYRMMSSLEFLPNTPTLMNAGTELGLLSACYVIPVEDSLESIFKALHDAAIVQQQAGGTGFSFSRLRPRGDIVKSTKGIASGPVTFNTIFDKMTDVIKQGGKRRGANMGILRVDHPDIIEFITAKSDPNMLRNFNVSVAVTDKFMEAVRKDESYDLINPRTKQPVKKARARDVWDLIITYAWKTGDPGVIFIDEINRRNPTSHVGEIESTNPCGEVPLHPYESCNLGSINLSKMLKEVGGMHELDWDKLRKAVHSAVHFLDNIIDANKYPVIEIEKATKANRRIGLGVMGFADLLCNMGIKYDSEEALKLAEKLMDFIESEGHKASQELGKKRGSFPNFKGSMWDKKKYKHMRNATVTTIAPTGTISIIAGCSSGIEPLFAVSFVRNVLEGTRLMEVNPVFEKIAKEQGFYSTELMHMIAKSGSVAGIKEVPEELRKVFVTALDIEPEWHVRMQAVFQKYTDNAVSKTINFREDAAVEEVRRAYELAYKLKCKGITIYRYGSKPEQVLYIGEIERKKASEKGAYTTAEAEFAGGCPTTLCPSPG